MKKMREKLDFSDESMESSDEVVEEFNMMD